MNPRSLASFASRAFLGLGILGSLPASADLSKYAGCPDLKASDFTFTPLINNAMDPTLEEPLKMAFDVDAGGNTDIYFTQRSGILRRYNGATKTTTTLIDFKFTAAQVPPPPDRNSFGLIGIALDPGFKTNRWIYLYIGLEREWKISRFVLNGSQIDKASERVIFRFDPGTTPGALTHIAGTLRFDEEGVLWVTVADNENKWQAANTNSYLGKIIRLKVKPFADNVPAPAPGAGSTYDIPAGNLYPENTDKAKPEIYVMGVRNPYSLALDPVRKGMAFGDVGPDGVASTKGTEEFNYTKVPGNFGWPFWAGEQTSLDAGHGTPAAPTNTRPDNSGLTTLKPAITATIPYPQACAVTGPIYRYDGNLKTKGKWPPHLDGAWIISDFSRNWIDAVELDPDGKVKSRLPLLTIASSGNQLDDPLEVQMGPDGILYVVNYSGFRSFSAKTGILKVEYKGECTPSAPARRVELAKAGAKIDGNWLAIDYGGFYEVAVFNAAGKVEFRRQGMGPARYDLQPFLGNGLRFEQIKTGTDKVIRKMFRGPL